MGQSALRLQARKAAFEEAKLKEVEITRGIDRIAFAEDTVVRFQSRLKSLQTLMERAAKLAQLRDHIGSVGQMWARMTFVNDPRWFSRETVDNAMNAVREVASTTNLLTISVTVEIQQLGVALIAVAELLGIETSEFKKTLGAGKQKLIEGGYLAALSIQRDIDVWKAKDRFEKLGLSVPKDSGHWRLTVNKRKNARRVGRVKKALTGRQAEALEAYGNADGNTTKAAFAMGITRQAFVEIHEAANKKLGTTIIRKKSKTVPLPIDRRGQIAVATEDSNIDAKLDEDAA